MIKKGKLLVSVLFGLAILSLTISCDNGDNCPDGMHEQTLQNGTTICVPD